MRETTSAAPGAPDASAAARIRNAAGLPPGLVPGPGPSARPGLAAPRRLREHGAIRIQSRADAAGGATRGSGSAGDPYVFADLSLDGLDSPEPFGLFWSDPFADYHVRLENVRLEGWAGAQIYVRTGTELALQHVELRGSEASGAAGIRLAGGRLSIEESVLTGLAGDGIQIVGDAPAGVFVSDTRFDESGGPWGAATRGVHSLNRGGSVTIRVLRCDFDAPSLAAAIRPWRSAELSLEDSRLRTCVGLEDGAESVAGLRVSSCLFETSHEAIRGSGLTGWEVAHSEFRDNAPGRRLVRLADCGRGSLHHSVLTKAAGGADDTCVEVVDSADLVLGHNWVTASAGAAFTLTRVGGASRVHHSVGDGLRGPFVTWERAQPGAGAIHDLWADLAPVAERLTEPVGLTAPVGLAEAGNAAPEPADGPALALASPTGT